MAMAQVQSANIVGYQDFTGSDSFYLAGPTFINVGVLDEGAAMKLGDIKVNASFEGGTDVVSVYGTDAMTQIAVSYLSKADATAEGVDEGWYLAADFDEWSFEHCYNSTPIAAGVGVGFARGKTGAGLIVPNPVE